jgi:hypothetical protein
MISLINQIDGLSDAEAITALTLALDGIGQRADPFTAAATDRHLHEALNQPDIRSDITPDPTATAGTLARTALGHLATQHPDIITRAITTVPNAATRFDPVTLTIGALILQAFRTDIDLTHDPDTGWRLHLHSKALTDTTIGNSSANSSEPSEPDRGL